MNMFSKNSKGRNYLKHNQQTVKKTTKKPEIYSTKTKKMTQLKDGEANSYHKLQRIICYFFYCFTLAQTFTVVSRYCPVKKK